MDHLSGLLKGKSARIVVTMGMPASRATSLLQELRAPGIKAA